MTFHSKTATISGKGDEGECAGKDPVSEKWRLVQATNAEAVQHLYLLSRKEESCKAVEPSRDCCVKA